LLKLAVSFMLACRKHQLAAEFYLSNSNLSLKI
jgi:hypothetical protein